MKTTFATLSLLAVGVMNGHAALAWTLGDSTVDGRAAPEIWSYYGTNGTTTFVQEGNGPTNPLPGDPNSPATNQQADDDFYFAGDYTNQVDGGAAYGTLGIVASTEVGIERAVTNGDTNNRYHFNFAGFHQATDVFTVTFGMLDLNEGGAGTAPGQFDFALSVNGVNLGNFAHTAATIGTPFVSDSFTLADVGGTAGANDDNYVELVASNAGTSAQWANFDYIRMDYEPIPEPSSLGFLALAAAGVTLIRRRRR
jgi:hypothetical protein